MTPEEQIDQIISKYSLDLNPGQREMLIYELAGAFKVAVEMAVAQAAVLAMEGK